MSNPQTGELVGLLQQAYIRRLIESDEMFNDVTVLAEDEGNVTDQMDKALGIVTTKDGARGACVLVRQPTGSDEMPGVNFPPLSLEWDILCLEWREMNKDTSKGGTGKRAFTLARRVHRILKAHRAPGILQCLVPKRPTLTRQNAERELNGVTVPLVGYMVRFSSNEADNTAYTKVAIPVVSGSPSLTPGVIATGAAGAVLTVTCATSGAAIYYTTDLSNPCAPTINPTSTLYTGPITSVAGTYLFRAFASGSIGSDAVAVAIT